MRRRTKRSVLEKRGHPRAVVEADFVCKRQDGTSFRARAKDLSIGGMFVLSEEVVTFGEELSILLTPVGTGKSLTLPAVVRWTQELGFGVQFGLLGARETHAISGLVRR